MPRFDDEHHQEAAGHYTTSGRALILVGAICLSVGGFLTFLADTDLGFIDGPSMMLFSAGLLAIGVWMASVGKDGARS